MFARFIGSIWHIRGIVMLPAGHSIDEALDRLDPLFGEYGTSHQRSADALTFRKKDQAAQDKMAVFDSGALWVEEGRSGLRLRYDLVSRSLLFCFLAPLLFLGTAGLTIFLGNHQHASEAIQKSAQAKQKRVEKPDAPMNPVDKALGAPAPEKKDPKKPDEAKKKPSPTPSYVFAAIFAVLYLVGRVLEDRMVKRVFRKALSDSDPTAPALATGVV